MIVNVKTKSYQTRSDKPNLNWLGEGWICIPDSSELASKVKRFCPNFEIVFDCGSVVDIKQVDPPKEFLVKEEVDKLNKEIEALKQQLSDSDYKLIKCYELSLLGEESEYDLETLHSERQSLRDSINEKESRIKELTKKEVNVDESV